MAYIFDNNSIRAMCKHSREIFPTLWKDFDRLVNERKILSVREVLRELEKCSDKSYPDIQWAEKNKEIFYQPTEKEVGFIKEMLKNQKAQKLVEKQNRMRGIPNADLFVIAKAKIENGTVVTEEKPTKMPNVCKDYNIPCINLEGFMREQKWEY